jgi:hypothetical protein
MPLPATPLTSTTTAVDVIPSITMVRGGMDHNDSSRNDDNAHARKGLAVHPHHRCHCGGNPSWPLLYMPKTTTTTTALCQQSPSCLSLSSIAKTTRNASNEHSALSCRHILLLQNYRLHHQAGRYHHAFIAVISTATRPSSCYHCLQTK